MISALTAGLRWMERTVAMAEYIIKVGEEGYEKPTVIQELVRCKDCKHNPKLEWFGCPMASLSEKQRPETAWCWKGERKDGDNG